MYINLHTKSHIFLNISIFSKKIITFSSSAHLMKSQHFSQNFNFFVKHWHSCTKIDIDRNTCHFASKFAQHYFVNELRNSIICPKTDTFCIKCYFLMNENATKNWHFSKTEDTSLRKLNISIKKTNIFENGDHLLQKWKKKILQNWRFCKIFAFTSEAHITKKLILLKQIVIVFRIDN